MATSEQFVIGQVGSAKLVFSYRFTGDTSRPVITWTRDAADAKKWPTRDAAETILHQLGPMDVELEVVGTSELQHS